MASTSKELLDCPGEKPSLIESIFSKKKDSLLESKRPDVGKPFTTAVPTSQYFATQVWLVTLTTMGLPLGPRSIKKEFRNIVLGKVHGRLIIWKVLGKAKDFLGILAKANEKLQQDTKENSCSKYDIEVLDGSDEEHIEMDLLLGVTDLHTTEAVAAAESTMSGFQASKSFSDSSSSDTESESDDDDDDDDNDGGENNNNLLSDGVKLQKLDSNKIPTKNRLKKRPKIVVLD